ncbi:MAG: T9SS type A sorting domain-containing protein, partial [Prevotella sp.]|nr:T9SS type A sorting domain-containing protein [Prevotella sp.]
TGEKKNTTIKLEKGQETELEADIDIWNVKAKSGKNYVYKYTLEKPVFDYLNAHPNTIPITTGLWNYWRTLSGIIPVGNSTERVEDALNDGMALLDYSKYPALKGSYTFERTKEYSASATISKKIGTPKWASWFGIDWSVTISGGVFMQSTFPLEESKYDFVAKEMRPVVEYEDLNKFAYYLPRLTWKDEIDALIDDIKSSLDLWDIIQDYAKSFRKTGEKHASAEKIQFSNEEGNRKKRLYSSQLKDYNKLQKDNRTGISTMSFDIAGNNQVFENNTRLSFSYYYPGGEVLGATVGQDTFIIISDVFYLHAYYQDSVSMPQAPYGNFKVFSEAGSDDLAFLDIHPSYSVGLYHQPLLDSLWRLIGNTNDTVSTNSLGTYCLGVKVSDDDIPPVINIMKNDNTKTLEITVTDNMAVYWKGVYVIVNGLLTECLHNGNTLTVNLTEEQLNDEIYVLVYASDLARNESQASSVFDKTETPPIDNSISNPVTNSSDCKVYPNPVLNNVYVFISDELRGNSSVKYIIVSPLGQTHLTGTIYKEETIINVEKLASGVYFIIVYDENKIITHKKIVKQ